MAVRYGKLLLLDPKALTKPRASPQPPAGSMRVLTQDAKRCWVTPDRKEVYFINRRLNRFGLVSLQPISKPRWLPPLPKNYRIVDATDLSEPYNTVVATDRGLLEMLSSGSGRAGSLTLWQWGKGGSSFRVLGKWTPEMVLGPYLAERSAVLVWESQYTYNKKKELYVPRFPQRTYLQLGLLPLSMGGIQWKRIALPEGFRPARTISALHRSGYGTLVVLNTDQRSVIGKLDVRTMNIQWLRYFREGVFWDWAPDAPLFP